MNYDPVTRWLAAASVTLLAFILAWALVASANRPSVNERLDSIEHQLTYLSCLALIPDTEQTEQLVAECQVVPDVDSEPGGK